MKTGRIELVSLAGGLVSFVAVASGLNVGFMENGGAVVPSGEVSNLTARVTVGDGGRFVTGGEGTLRLSLANVDAAKDYRLEVSAGSLQLQPGIPTARPSDVPSVVSGAAAFWVDASCADSVVKSGEAVVRWCDRRETDPVTPTRYYAAHACRSGATKDAVQTLVEKDGRAAVHFGGYDTANGSYMKFYVSGGAAMDKELGKIQHVFLVHGMYEAWGSVLGNDKGSTSDMFIGAEIVEAAKAVRHFIYYGTTSPAAFGARHFLDGEKFDPYSVPPKSGFQLYEADYLDCPSFANAFFNERNSAGRQGGDYLSEAILFTNRLTEAERIDVERYLMRKWNLGDPASGKGVIAIASGAKVELAIDDGSEAFPSVTVEGGAVEKSGAGTLALTKSALGLSSDTELNLSDGEAFVQARPLPALKAAGGESLHVGEVVPQGVDPSDEDQHARVGVRIARTAAAVSPAAIEKTGNEELRLRAIPEGVRRIRVKGGTLTLAGETPASVVAEGTVSAVVPNADFEAPLTGDIDWMNRRRLQVDETLNGWTCLRTGPSAGVFYIIENDASHSGRRTLCPFPIVQGRQVLCLYRAAAAMTTVHFPAKGRYRLSFRESSGTGYEGADTAEINARAYVTVKIGVDEDTAAVVVPTRPAMWGPFTRFYYELPEITEAGDLQLFVISSGKDGFTSGFCIDDMRIDFIPDPKPTGVVKIPNGDFEKLGEVSVVKTMSATLESEGWTLSELGENPEPKVAIVTPSTPAMQSADSNPGIQSVRWGDVADGQLGVAALAFATSGGVAERTFALAAGTYRLRGKLAHWEVKWNETQNPWTVDSTVQAWMVLPSGLADLGSAKCTTHTLLPYLWPNAFTLTSPGDVTLRLKQTNGQGMCIADDFELVEVGSVADDATTGGELVVNGSFEDGDASWTRIQDTAGNWPGNTSYSSYPAIYGAFPYDGKKFMNFMNDCVIRQKVKLVAGGLYRLSFAAHSRLDRGYQFNPVHAYLADTSSALNRELDIGFTDCYVTNWVVHTWDFRAPSTGEHWLCLQGDNPEEGSGLVRRQSVLDGVSLKRLGTDALVTPPAVPETTRIALSAGARLRLDYDGTVTVGGFSHDGRGVADGIVDATTHPELVSGRGKLNVVHDSGFVILFR